MFIFYLLPIIDIIQKRECKCWFFAFVRQRSIIYSNLFNIKSVKLIIISLHIETSGFSMGISLFSQDGTEHIRKDDDWLFKGNWHWFDFMFSNSTGGRLRYLRVNNIEINIYKNNNIINKKFDSNYNCRIPGQMIFSYCPGQFVYLLLERNLCVLTKPVNLSEPTGFTVQVGYTRRNFE